MNKNIKIIIFSMISMMLIVTSISVLGTNYEKTKTEEEIGNWRIVVDVTNNEESTYNGHLRAYAVEPVSRWNMYDENPYHYSSLDYPIDEDVSIDSNYIKNITWNPETVGGIDENNIMVIAVLFNATPHERYSYENHPFDAYFVDAAAGATPGNTGYNKVTNEFTHTVFAEEGTATWCPHCPDAADALNDIYQSGDYPFYFVSLVTNKNKAAQERCNDYNVYGIPVTFFDGGYQVYIGSFNVKNEYRNKIESCGEREVPNLDLSASFRWDPDMKPPTISITKPEKNGLYVFNEKKKEINKTIIVGTMNIEVETSDTESEVEKVEFYINDELRREDNYRPFSFSNWKEDKFFGKYEIKVVAYDEAENQGIAKLEVLRFF